MMNLTVAGSTNEFYSIVAWRIAAQVITKPDSVIGLATGRTTGGIHKALCDIHAAHPFDVSRLRVFGMDEVTGVSRDYFGSCYYMLLHEVVLPLGIKMEHYIMPPTMSDDFAREADLFQRAIEGLGGVDLQILGIGENGHIGFNQPGTPFGTETWLSRMDERLDARIRNETNSGPDADLGGLTLGIKNVMHSRRIILAANGTNKAAIVREALQGPVSEAVPSSVLQLHPFCEVVLDPDAASQLRM